MNLSMKLRRTHIPDKLLNSRKKRISENLLLDQVQEILDKVSCSDEVLISRLNEAGDDGNVEISNNFKISLLEPEKIFHISDIEKTCIHYRLRFLDAHLYKAAFPYETLIKIKELEKLHEIAFYGYKLMAPASVFKLKNADDPLLFVPIGNDYYYLIHSLGERFAPIQKNINVAFQAP